MKFIYNSGRLSEPFLARQTALDLNTNSVRIFHSRSPGFWSSEQKNDEGMGGLLTWRGAA